MCNELFSSETFCDLLQIDHLPQILFKPIQIGMEFDSKSEAYQYYNDYVKEIRFSIPKEYANKNRKYGYVTSRKYMF